jgi:septum site-determining protein MinD
MPIAKGEMMTVEDVLEILAVPLLGIIPESPAVLRASNVGTPIVLDEPSAAGAAYEDAVARLVGETVEMRVAKDPRPGILWRLLGRSA